MYERKVGTPSLFDDEIGLRSGGDITLCSTENISGKILRLFKACNSAPSSWIYKQLFYGFKTDFLQKHAQPAGYDLQIIKRECYSCNGTGIYKFRTWDGYLKETCYRCDKGIYAINRVRLKRWLLCGHIFHQPIARCNENGIPLNITDMVSEAVAQTNHVPYTSLIHGIITHPAPAINPTFAFLCLLFRYDRQMFFKLCEQQLKYSAGKQKAKLKKLMRTSKSTLRAFAKWFDINETDIAEFIDEAELPF